jgi:anaerobic magnesium-protoporphyrin IX monomethyl ester cyclase
VWTKAHGFFGLNMAASWLPFRCNWGAKPIWGNQYAQRSAESVAAEFTYLKQRFNPDHIWFADDIFGFKPNWVTRFGHAVRQANAHVPFTIQTRADLTSEAMAKALHEAGCAEAWIGAESGSQRILDAMNKGATVAEIKRHERARRCGIRSAFIQLGYMASSSQTSLPPASFQEARPDDVGVSVAYPPGAVLRTGQGRSKQQDHWKDGGDRDDVRGTYILISTVRYATCCTRKSRSGSWILRADRAVRT